MKGMDVLGAGEQEGIIRRASPSPAPSWPLCTPPIPPGPPLLPGDTQSGLVPPPAAEIAAPTENLILAATEEDGVTRVPVVVTVATAELMGACLREVTVQVYGMRMMMLGFN